MSVSGETIEAAAGNPVPGNPADPCDHTFLFADLVGFTALADLEGDDRALEVVLSLQRRVRELLPRHGAEQVKAIGDGLMLRCLDPQAAIRLGLQLVDEMAADPGLPPLRVGIHTGPALSNEGDWYGRTVNVAARLCAVAPGGEVIVSEATRRAAGDVTDVDWSGRELHWLRNVSEPVSTYIVSRLAPPADPPTAAGRRSRRLAWRLVCPKAAFREATA